ncbi:acetyl/propionyl/methylcrotonyl-CoA carboxylase subunit alpha [Jonesia denitrificans]|uniref:biotin carboxylase n=1 Tax=Jonesia denitrificans (strain ATCC 14870 / DSM 20603 / BCRC 15368 / CIP 55.134 / JCM 11481 / NBRC 15587 / NCTC 10816 / Prevot 55134) TaxID=471856 RepID=C7R2D6_JONDD|nr:biotin carboxylase N-terminal domain-containing protein [Jonesia denitrificans]ACV08507.1 Carbamoyl-phosphate synthase L chain ATP- binding [Jonesia denitrificans DSM 20603]QXB42462.1 ATP-grasp domain-containing protein [Jonesia denitrificans]SQH20488.1 Acetyl-/propionyl-coenzyme A carboxylase alpha chain [Jonesia denitrificans]
MPVISKVLIANRGEIAVRIIRACADYGVGSVAVYADSDREALHVRLADEAYSLHGARAADTYLDIAKLIDVAKRSGANAVHPGYGFLAENSAFAQAVIDAGLMWIGPSPAAIDALGDKVSARHIAQRAGAPLVPGTADPVESAQDVHAFAAEHGLPIAIKAAFGGGGRGLKVARNTEDITELFDSAVREATAAFGRGECFVERYLDRPRHVETQCLADTHGNVVVVSTRDCSLQRRHQKLVEEAPAPFLSEEQNTRLIEASHAILKEAKYHGAGTCEFLVGNDGTISFLEVNTRLQVEHPVTEEITGIDLVIEQFRIAEGHELGFTEPTPRGHSLEFRINGEDPAANFLPQPGRITALTMPSGPGVRVDSGVVEGDVISGAFDSMVAKIIVTGRDRAQAIARARRALAETRIEGLPTVLPFHRAVLDCPAFAPSDPSEPFSVYTSWIETEFHDTCRTLTATPAVAGEPEPATTERVVVEVGGKRLEVVIPAGLSLASRASHPTQARAGARRPARRNNGGSVAVHGNSLTSPMQGTIVKLAVEPGTTVAAGDLIVVLEAMKMEQPLTAHRAGTVTSIHVSAGDSVTAGALICDIND